MLPASSENSGEQGRVWGILDRGDGRFVRPLDLQPRGKLPPLCDEKVSESLRGGRGSPGQAW